MESLGFVLAIVVFILWKVERRKDQEEFDKKHRALRMELDRLHGDFREFRTQFERLRKAPEPSIAAPPILPDEAVVVETVVLEAPPPEPAEALKEPEPATPPP